MLNMLKLLALSGLLILNLNSFGTDAKGTIQFTRSESGNHYWYAGKPTTRTGYFLGLVFSAATTSGTDLSLDEIKTLAQANQFRTLYATRSNDIAMGDLSKKLNEQQKAEEAALIKEAKLAIETSTNPDKIAHAHAVLATFKPRSGCIIS